MQSVLPSTGANMTTGRLKSCACTTSSPSGTAAGSCGNTNQNSAVALRRVLLELCAFERGIEVKTYPTALNAKTSRLPMVNVSIFCTTSTGAGDGSSCSPDGATSISAVSSPLTSPLSSISISTSAPPALPRLELCPHPLQQARHPSLACVAASQAISDYAACTLRRYHSPACAAHGAQI